MSAGAEQPAAAKWTASAHTAVHPLCDVSEQQLHPPYALRQREQLQFAAGMSGFIAGALDAQVQRHPDVPAAKFRS